MGSKLFKTCLTNSPPEAQVISKLIHYEKVCDTCKKGINVHMARLYAGKKKYIYFCSYDCVVKRSEGTIAPKA